MENEVILDLQIFQYVRDNADIETNSHRTIYMMTSDIKYSLENCASMSLIDERFPFVEITFDDGSSTFDFYVMDRYNNTVTHISTHTHTSEDDLCRFETKLLLYNYLLEIYTQREREKIIYNILEL